MANTQEALEKIRTAAEQYVALDRCFMRENDEGTRASMRAFETWRDTGFDPAQKPEPTPPFLSRFGDGKKSYTTDVTHHLRNGSANLREAFKQLAKKPESEHGSLYQAIVEICEDHFPKGREALSTLLSSLETQKEKIAPGEEAAIARIKDEMTRALEVVDEVIAGGKEFKAALGIGSGEGRTLGGGDTKPKKTE